MRIGELARACGVNVQTVRYYERRGLLPDPRDGVGGYRDYDEAVADRLRFVREAQLLGFTLREIADLLALRAAGGGAREVRDRAREKLADVQGRIAALRRLERSLAELIEGCPGQGPSSSCTILGRLERPGLPTDHRARRARRRGGVDAQEGADRARARRGGRSSRAPRRDAWSVAAAPVGRGVGACRWPPRPPRATAADDPRSTAAVAAAARRAGGPPLEAPRGGPPARPAAVRRFMFSAPAERADERRELIAGDGDERGVGAEPGLQLAQRGPGLDLERVVALGFIHLFPDTQASR